MMGNLNPTEEQLINAKNLYDARWLEWNNKMQKGLYHLWAARVARNTLLSVQGRMLMETEAKEAGAGKWRLIDMQVEWERDVFPFGFWKVCWGADIFINDVPILKSIVLANIIVWIILFGR